MKSKQILVLVLCLIFVFIFIGANLNKEKSSLASSYHNSKTLDINQIHFPLTNTGNINWRFDNYQLVTWEQIEEYNFIVFDQGLWVVGKINDIPYWAYGKWASAYSPGPIIDGQAAMLINPEDSLRYRVYKISAGDDDSNPDYLEWPIDFGAPVDKLGDPRIYADQTLWTVYNGLDSTTDGRSNSFDTMAVMPVEVNQTVYGREGLVADAENIFSNITFLEYQVINKGMENIDSTYIGFWTDIDFLHAFTNPPGVDTVNQLGYCWCSWDIVYGYPNIIPPAVGYVQLYGPAIPSAGNNAVLKGKKLENFKNLSLSTFHGIRDDAWVAPLDGNPSSLNHTWNVARGLDMTGNIIVDPTTGQPTMFPFSGDPVTNTGWIWDNGTDGGAGFVMFSGPFTLAPGDTQWVMYALIPAQGGDRFQSIKAMRKKASILREMSYDSLAFGKRAIGIWYAGEAQVTLEKVYLKPDIDSLVVQASFPTPDHDNISAQAVINSVDETYTDSLFLFDDGNHHDQEADDGIWGTIIPPFSEENEFDVSLYVEDLDSKAMYMSDELAKFTTIGPIVFDEYTILSADTIPNPGDQLVFQLTLQNEGLSASAENVSMVVTSLDTCVIFPASNSSDFGDIIAGEAADGNPATTIRFSGDCADSSWVSFKLDIYSNQTHFWTDTFSVFVHGSPSSISEPKTDIPDKFALFQNYPNPFNPSTMINYQLPISNDVELSIYNLLGQKIVTLVSGRQAAGYYQVGWDASGFASGIYYYHIHAGEFQEIKKMVLLR